MSTPVKRVTFAIAANIVAIAMILSIVSVSTDLWITSTGSMETMCGRSRPRKTVC